MRITIMGAAAVGGYFGGLLSRAGHAVTFIARGADLAALREHGLVLEPPNGRLDVDAARFVPDPSEAGSCDGVPFAVKNCDIESAAAPRKPLVDGGAWVIFVLNGVDHQDRIASVVGASAELGGLAIVSGVIVDPSVTRYTSNMSGIRFGEADGSMSERALAFRDTCVAAGFSAEVVSDIRAEKMLARGIAVGLGTDGEKENNNLDRFEEMKVASLLAKFSRLDAAAMDFWDVCRMATVTGARTLGLGGDIGTQEAGKQADIVAVRTDTPRMTPAVTGRLANLHHNLVFAVQRGDVRTTRVAGRVVVDAGRLLSGDLAADIAEANRAVPGLVHRREAWLQQHRCLNALRVQPD